MNDANNIAGKASSRRSGNDADSIKDFSIEKVLVMHVGPSNDSFKKFTSEKGENSINLISILNKYHYSSLPRNSCIGKRISNGMSEYDAGSCVLFPFFSSHMSLPIKAGEVVWAIFDRGVADAGFWITRCHSDERGEDLNFSHYDRRFEDVSIDDKNSKNSANKFNSKKLGDQQPSQGSSSYSPHSFSTDLFENAISNNSKQLSVYEPVPRFTKRPGDFVIQGSNNSMICLGTDRYWTKENVIEGIEDVESSANSRESIKKFSGSIDLVAGRSRYLTLNLEKSTSPRTITNSTISSEEVDKSDTSKIQTEGDPEFYTDASRIYVCMNTNVDRALSLSEYTPILPSQTEKSQDYEGAAAFVKSDHIRIVARKQDDDNFKINGTIKIIKEGALSGEGADGSSIILHEDGNVHIASSQKIYFGLSKEEGGDSARDSDGDPKGEGQPYIRYQELKTLMIDLTRKVDELKSSYNNFTTLFKAHIHPGLNSPPTPDPLGGPEIFNFGFEDLINNEIESIKSKKIFGE